jgi:hypothetical protein
MGMATVAGTSAASRASSRSARTADQPPDHVRAYGNERVGLEMSGQLNRDDYEMKFNQALGVAT